MKSRERWALGFGLLAGAAAGFFLASDKGRQLRADANVKLNEYGETISKTAKEQTEAISANIDTALTKSKQLVDDLSSMMKEKVNYVAGKTETAVEGAEDSIQKGINKARRKVQEKTENINEISQNKA